MKHACMYKAVYVAPQCLKVQLDGGGEKKGIEGIEVGIEGIVDGIFGNEVTAGMGGTATLGTVGNVGNVGFGKDGRFVGNVGKGVLDNGGNAAAGKFGMEGNVGIEGIVGIAG